MSVFVADQALVRKLQEYVRNVLSLPEDTVLDPDQPLADQTNLDSIEAFNAVATLHEILGVEIPDDFDPKAFETVRALAAYLRGRYPAETVEKLFSADFSRLAADSGGL